MLRPEVGPGRFAVVGKDGLIGARLFETLRSAGADVLGTSRRPAASSRILPLDLARGPADPAALAAERVLFCAAVTSMRACEQDPQATRTINVANTVRSIELLMERGAFVVYLSSSAVFDGRSPLPAEVDPLSPSTEYALQKAEAEARLRSLAHAGERLCIVRLTKVVDPSMPLLQGFLERLRRGEPLEAFDDLVLSPMSLGYVTDALLRIAGERSPGAFHLSGEAELSYAELAAALAQRLRADRSLVRAVPSSARGAPAPFRPRHPALGMPATQDAFGLRPQPLAGVLAALVP